MLDFPNSPTLNQQFTGPNGVIWSWDGTKWTSIASTNQYAATNNVGRNYLHNPLFAVAQRGSGFSATGYTLDRWFVGISLDTSSITRGAAADAFRTAVGDEAADYYLSAAVTANAGAGAYTFLAQFIENVRRLAGKTVTISFWANATAGAPKIGVALGQRFGSGGSPSAAVDVATTPITISTTATRYSVTVSVPSVAGKTLGTNNDHYTQFALWLSSGATFNAAAGGIGVQSNTFVLWGMQLEIGSVATPLEKPDPQQDLAKCQRFFQTGQLISGGLGTAGGVVYFSTALPVPMRASATIVPGNVSNSNCSAATAGSYNNALSGACTVWFSTTATTSAPYSNTVNFTASADL